MKKSKQTQQTLSSAARQALKRMGANVREARVRRNMTQAELADRACTSHVTLMRLEKGDPSVGLGVLVRVLDILGLTDDLVHIAHPDSDALGKTLSAAKTPKRVRTKSVKRDNLDF